EPLVVVDAGGLEPVSALDELPHGELHGDALVRDDVVPGPVDAAGRAGAGALVLVLAVEERLEREVGAVPLEPTPRVDVRVQVGQHVHRPRVLLPRPAQERRELLRGGRQVGRRDDAAPVDGRPGVLVRVGPALRRDRVLLRLRGAPRREHAALEHRRGVAEHEVHRAGDGAVAVELAELVRVQGVLVAVQAAAVDHGAVGAHAEGHRLLLLGARRVLHLEVLEDDPVARQGCTHAYVTHISKVKLSHDCLQSTAIESIT
ncbi:Os01g0788451, partial [Oryza sativa Japonica Group]